MLGFLRACKYGFLGRWLAAYQKVGKKICAYFVLSTPSLGRRWRTDWGSLWSRKWRLAPACFFRYYLNRTFSRAGHRQWNMWRWSGRAFRRPGMDLVRAPVCTYIESLKWMQLKFNSEVWPWLTSIWENSENISSHIIYIVTHIYHFLVFNPSKYFSFFVF